jgi:hypothetical protein
MCLHERALTGRPFWFRQVNFAFIKGGSQTNLIAPCLEEGKSGLVSSFTRERQRQEWRLRDTC